MIQKEVRKRFCIPVMQGGGKALDESVGFVLCVTILWYLDPKDIRCWKRMIVLEVVHVVVCNWRRLQRVGHGG
jgi:hypothetical protein